MRRLKGATLKGAAGGLGVFLVVCAGDKRERPSRAQCVEHSFPTNELVGAHTQMGSDTQTF